MATREELQNLVEQLDTARRGLAARGPELYPLEIVSDTSGSVIATVAPRPGASEEELAAAESVLGRGYPADVRELLSITNGWSDVGVGLDILGTAGVGVLPGMPGYPDSYPSSTWGIARESLRVMFDEADNEVTRSLRLDDCIPVTACPETADFHFVITSGAEGAPAGSIYSVEQGSFTVVGGVADLLRQLIDVANAL